ncbi:hypothetical protein O3M35_008727 [Rhynocoris fuscipes]|uniref:Polycystic kidney disease 2-like 1 protein n=1 Tax=Rhynocoris fuscipes TaxID=488301 RepID=A0AAW1D8K0_9HEMI
MGDNKESSSTVSKYEITETDESESRSVNTSEKKPKGIFSRFCWKETSEDYIELSTTASIICSTPRELSDEESSESEEINTTEVESEPEKGKRRSSLPDDDLLNWYQLTYQKTPLWRWHTWARSRYKGNPKDFMCVCFRELFLYSIFLACFFWIIVSGIQQHQHNYCSVILNLFTSTMYKVNSSSVNSTSKYYMAISTIEDVWIYLSNHFAPVVYSYSDEHYYLEEKGSVMRLLGNILVGPPRIRQVRVRNDSCEVPHLFQSWYNSCYSYYLPKQEEKESFGPANNVAWDWREQPTAFYKAGKISYYTSNGYYFDMHKDYKEFNDLIMDLKKQLWIDRGTRVVFIDFVLYTPDANLLSAVELMLEMPPGGGVIPTAKCHPIKLFWFMYTDETIIFFIVAITMVTFLIYFILILLLDLKHIGPSHLLTFWGILDLIIIICFSALIYSYLYVKYVIYRDLPAFINIIDNHQHSSFDYFIMVYHTYKILLATMAILCCIKLLKFFAMFSTVSMLFAAIGKCKVHLLTSSLMGIMLLMAFSLFAHFIFGTQVEEFSTLLSSIATLLHLRFSSVHYFEQMDQDRPILSGLFLLTFIFLFVIIFMTSFIAILVEGVKEAEDDRALKGPLLRYGPYEYFRFKIVEVFDKLHYGKLERYFRQKLKLSIMSMRRQLLLAMFRRQGVFGLEIMLFLQGHGINTRDKHHVFTEELLSQIEQDLKLKQDHLYKEILEHDYIEEEIDELNEKLANIEETLHNTKTSLESAYAKLGL